MKILLLNWRDSTHPKSGGAEYVTEMHCNHWSKMGHAVTWITAGYATAKRNELLNDITIIRLGGSYTVYLYAAKYLIQHGNEYDVIVDEFHGLPFLAPLLTKIPVVAFIHEVAGEIWDFMLPFPLGTIGKIIEKLLFLFYRNSLFWTDAPSMIPELVSYGIPKNNITAIPCPIIHPPKLKKIPEKEPHPTFVFLNRIVPMKGIEDILMAFHYLHQSIPESKLWIVGSGEQTYLESLKGKAKILGINESITWWGKVTTEDKYRLLAQAHLLLHASVKEGWGLVVLEAAAVGTPSVVYPVTGLVDVVKNGETGVVSHTTSPESLKDSALELINNKVRYTQFQKAGREWVKSLSWEDITTQSMDLLKKAISRAV